MRLERTETAAPSWQVLGWKGVKAPRNLGTISSLPSCPASAPCGLSTLWPSLMPSCPGTACNRGTWMGLNVWVE
ncbi:similar to hypothetical protein (predicted), isoform CRA_b [Rattus norvegicus]|uniref:Uncharacterized protein RGD1564195_predicted n=1 Tax=Rattus norvegicus TaxID=10116 RepID=A6I9K2_RAT|nr:similar to hypothetical protein (predicted), isoform CRA_b [Rattus norvegicus]